MGAGGGRGGAAARLKKEFSEIFASEGFWGTVPAIHAITNSPRPNITAQYYAPSKYSTTCYGPVIADLSVKISPTSPSRFRRPLRQGFADLSVKVSPTSPSRFRRPLRQGFADLSVKVSPTSPSRFRRPLRQDFADLSVKVSPTSPSRFRRPLRQDFADLFVKISPTSPSRFRRPLRQVFADLSVNRGSGTASVQRFSSSPHEEFYQSPNIFDPGTT